MIARNKHLVVCFLVVVFNVSCKKGPGITAPSLFSYTPDTAFVLLGMADTSATPMIDWNGRKGGFGFLGPVPQGVTIDAMSGKISWTSSLAIGTYLLRVSAGNGASAYDSTNYMLSVSGKIMTIAGVATAGFSGDGFDALGAQFNEPMDVTVDPQNNIYVADEYNERIRKITPQGLISTIAGDSSYGFAGDGGPAIRAFLNGPSGIVSDGRGNLYISELGDGRIRKIDAAGIITTVAGNDSAAPNLGEGGAATQAWIHSVPAKVALDGGGSLYFSDYASQLVRKVTPDGIIHTIAGTGSGPVGMQIADGTSALQAGIAGPSGLYWDAAGGNLFIVSNLSSAIYRINGGDIFSAGGITWDGPFVGPLNRPTNIVGDRDGNLFIADYANARIRRIDTRGVITTVAGNGKQGFSGDGGPAAAAELSMCYGLAVDSIGNLYIADTYNNRIRKVILH